MKYAEINKRYTEIIAEYLNKGYTINTSSMSGHQGEIAKIDLTDGKEIIRIVISTFYYWETDTSYDGVEITIGKSIDREKPNSNDTVGVIWNNRLEVIHEERFYKIGYRSDYYGTKEQATKAYEIKIERYEAKHSEKDKHELSAKEMEIAKRIIRNKLGYKRITDSEVELSRKSNGYIVGYKGKYYHLH